MATWWAKILISFKAVQPCRLYKHDAVRFKQLLSYYHYYQIYLSYWQYDNVSIKTIIWWLYEYDHIQYLIKYLTPSAIKMWCVLLAKKKKKKKFVMIVMSEFDFGTTWVGVRKYDKTDREREIDRRGERRLHIWVSKFYGPFSYQCGILWGENCNENYLH